MYQHEEIIRTNKKSVVRTRQNSQVQLTVFLSSLLLFIFEDENQRKLRQVGQDMSRVDASAKKLERIEKELKTAVGCLYNINAVTPWVVCEIDLHEDFVT